MTGYQIWALFGAPTVLLVFAGLLMGLQRLMPRPRLDGTGRQVAPVLRSHVGEAAD